MKDTCLPALHHWSRFQPDRRIDFNAFFWQRPEGGLLIDPLPMSDAQAAFVDEHGGAATILVTNADHWRAAGELAVRFGAAIHAPAADRERLADRAQQVTGWYAARGDLPADLRDVVDLHWIRGGKTAAEAVLHLEPLRALVFGDAVRSHASGRLRLLPDEKLSDRARVVADLLALRDLDVAVILLGDGDSLFTGARGAFLDFLRDLPATS